MLRLELRDEDHTHAVGARLAAALRRESGPVVITLDGPLGSGKTTFVRGVLRALGVDGVIRSPSFALMEEYEAAGWELLHLDLYRLVEGESLESLGLRERHRPGATLLVEWPGHAGPGQLPPVDLALSLEAGPDGHRMWVRPGSPTGERLVAALGAEDA